MKANMAVLDRVVRIALAALVAVLFVTHQLSAVAAIVLGIVAVLFLATSVVGFCPLYRLLGISTKRRAAA